LTVAQDAAAEKLRHEMRIPLAPVERAYRDEYLEAARAALSAAEFSEYWEKGRRWSISEALSEPDRLGPLIASAASPVSSGN